MAAVDVALGSPRGVTPFALIAVGHPEHKPEPKGPTRYDETRVPLDLECTVISADEGGLKSAPTEALTDSAGHGAAGASVRRPWRDAARHDGRCCARR